MSRIRANQITNKGANGAPNFPNGLTVTGIVTATVSNSTIGTLAVTGNATIDGNLGVAGTITYEDVARVDATGISTFREGFGVGPLAGIALTAYKDGSIRTSGIITANTYYGSGANLTGIDATQIVTGNTSVQTVDTGSDGHVKVTTEGTERFRITNSGDVGIGTISIPTNYGVAVLGATSSEYQSGFFRNYLTGARGYHINIGAAKDDGTLVAGASVSGEVDQTASTSGQLAFKTLTGGSLTEKLRIGSAGQFGIGGANYGSAGQVLKSGGASAAPTWGAAGGITHIDHWHKNGNQDGTSFNPVTTWNRTTNAEYGNLNSQMTEASGIFTFPATGLWFVSFKGWYYANARATRWFQTRIHATIDNSNYEQVSDASNAMSGGTSSNAYNSTFSFFIFDVTNTTNCKIKFSIDSQNTIQIMGGKNFTSARFIRVGDT